MLAPWKKNDRKARYLIFGFSIIVFAAVVLLSRVQLKVDLGFDVHLFAGINAVLNSCVALLLVAGLITAKNKKYTLHKRIMLTAITFSVFFLISYILHHLLAGDTRFGDSNLDGIISAEEKAAVGSVRMVYYIILGTHI